MIQQPFHNNLFMRLPHSGFSLVETLVAITLLLLVVVGPLGMTSRTSAGATLASEQVIAHFLAQEGLEIIQKAREDVMLAAINSGTPGATSAAWNQFSNPTGVYASCFAARCGLELVSDGTAVAAPRDCSTISNCLLYLNAAAGIRSMYTYSTGVGFIPTAYTRSIKMTYINADEIKLESLVTWRTGSLVASQQVRLESTLFNVYGI